MKLIVTQGIPASGKSTWAKKLAEDNPITHVRVCRDDMREMAGKYWVPDREDYITQIEECMVDIALFGGYNVIVDATNLNSKALEKWRSIADKYGAEFEIKRFDVELDEAIKRDSERGLSGLRSVGKEVIKNFHRRYIKSN